MGLDHTCWHGSKIFGRQAPKGVVCVNGSYSDWADVTSGVPQGSVLGPMLFVVLVVINDLPAMVSSLCQMYADDTKVFFRIKCSLEEKDCPSIIN